MLVTQHFGGTHTQRRRSQMDTYTERVPPSAWDRQEGRMGTDSRKEGGDGLISILDLMRFQVTMVTHL